MSLRVCTRCHYVGTPRYVKRGSNRAAFGAWLIFPFGLPYTLWRMFSKIPECSECGERLLVKVDSPLGTRIIEADEAERNGATPAPLPMRKPMQPIPLADEAPKEEKVEFAPKSDDRKPVDPDQW